MMSMTTWRRLIQYTAEGDQITDCTLLETDLDIEFDDGYGGAEGRPFTAWSDEWVYFPVVYDGSEWVGRVRRNPCGEASGHHGGE